MEDYIPVKKKDKSKNKKFLPSQQRKNTKKITRV